jgi:signal transduction histidine kinase
MTAFTLARLRLQLTAWYVVTLVAILVLLGGGLFVAIRGQLASQLDRSLADATTEVARAARTRESEAATARGQVVDAVEELRIPERMLYLLDANGAPVVPKSAPDWVREAAARAAQNGMVQLNHDSDADRTLRLRAERFSLASGAPMVAVATADEIELEDRYASLIAAFSVAAAMALLLVAAGGWFLVRKSTRPVEESMDRMRRFMADAAHELRTPITVLRSRADVTLQQPREPAELVASLRAMDAESRRLGRIVDDLMTLARADAGERPIERRRVSLDDIALDAADAARAMADAKGVSMQMSEFEEAWVDGDPALLRQLLMVLLDNAVKFTPPGGTVTLAVGVRAGRPTVEVKDTGVGIPAADLSHIFDRFYRGDPARTRGTEPSDQNGGAGLGLSIARWIAEAHGAAIEVQSASDVGSTFAVTFPSSTGRVSSPGLSAS